MFSRLYIDSYFLHVYVITCTCLIHDQCQNNVWIPECNPKPLHINIWMQYSEISISKVNQSTNNWCNLPWQFLLGLFSSWSRLACSLSKTVSFETTIEDDTCSKINFNTLIILNSSEFYNTCIKREYVKTLCLYLEVTSWYIERIDLFRIKGDESCSNMIT